MATTHKDDHNNANDAINKIEAELGIAPSGAAATVTARLDDIFNLAEAQNIVLGTTTGTKIGTAASQKLGFFNATPVIQPTSIIEMRTALVNLGLLGSGGYYTTGSALEFTRTATNLAGSNNNGVRVFGQSKGTMTVNDRLHGFWGQMTDAAAVVNKTITGMSRSGTTVTVTSTAHTFVNGDKIAIYGVSHTFNAEVNGAWTVANAAANTFDITVAGLSSGTYTSGGTATNRPMYYCFTASVAPIVDRGNLTGTAQYGDDVNLYNGINSGTAKATDAFYLGRNTGIAGSEWITAFTVDANADYGIRLNGTFAQYGLDLSSGTFTNGAIRLGSGHNVVLSATTGTKIGTATSEKLAFHNSTPVIQRAGAAQVAVATTGATSSTPFGYTTAAQANALVTLVNEIRDTLVEKGLMKGAA